MCSLRRDVELQRSREDRDAENDASARSRRLQTRIALVTISVCLGVWIAEFALRVRVCMNAGSCAPMFRRTVRTTPKERPDPVRHHALKEGGAYVATGTPPGLEFCVFGQVSDQGLNDDHMPIRKLPSQKRVLVLGDSFVEACEVRRDQNFCEVLEKRLAARLPYPLQVINAGVSTYSPLLEYVYYKRVLWEFQPDIVLQAFFANDVADDLGYSRFAIYDSGGLPLAVLPLRTKDQEDDQTRFSRALHRRPGWLASRSYLAALVGHTWTARRVRREFPQPPLHDQFFILQDAPGLGPQKEKGWALTRRYISLLEQACESDGARLILTAVPMAAQIYGQSTYDTFFFRGRPTEADQVEVRKIARALNVEFIDLLGPLKRAGRGLYFPRDGHWTPKGHRVAADTIEPHLLSALQQKM